MSAHSNVVPRAPAQAPVTALPARHGVRLRLLGGFDLRVDGIAVSLPASAQRLVALLALRGRTARPRLAGALWPDVTEARAMGCLRTAIWRVNQTSPGLVAATPGAVALTAEADVDVRRLVDSARRVLAGDESGELADLRPPDGDLLPDWEDVWLEADRERLRQLQLHVLEAQAESLMRRHAFGLALEWALAAVRAEPLRESAHRAVIRIHLAEGNVAEARRSYARCAELFDRELGLLPSEAARELSGPCATSTDAPVSLQLRR